MQNQVRKVAPAETLCTASANKTHVLVWCVRLSRRFKPVQNVPIVTAATTWQSNEIGHTYILVFYEALWMGDLMKDTLINLNQLRHFGTKAQDNPMSNFSLLIIT